VASELDDVGGYVEQPRTTLPRFAKLGELVARATETAVTVSAARALESFPGVRLVLTGVTTTLVASAPHEPLLTADAPKVSDRDAIRLELRVHRHARLWLCETSTSLRWRW
jgi:hypothetical protein